jgi:hypothetical protein
LTTTRSARKAWDLHAPVDVGVITFRAASHRDGGSCRRRHLGGQPL